MPERWINKLTVFGTQKELAKFLKSNWKKDLRGRYWELHSSSVAIAALSCFRVRVRKLSSYSILTCDYDFVEVLPLVATALRSLSAATMNWKSNTAAQPVRSSCG
jgi:hypothetical protein